MRDGRLSLRPAIPAAALTLISLSWSGGYPLKAGLLEHTQFLADLRAVDLSGQRWDEQSLKGKVVLIDFWASWCGPCLEEFPSLKEIYRKYHPRGLEIIGVSLDTEGRRELERWLRRLRLPWPQVATFRGYSDDLALRFGVTSLPASFLINRRGELVEMNLRGQSLRRAIMRLCDESLIN